jgi:2-isopropylmalate synthase
LSLFGSYSLLLSDLYRELAVMSERVYLYDSTLRDGAQTSGIDFTPADKRAIALSLDTLGIDYIEGGWPGANPTDDAFFASPPSLARARLSAFGMTRKASTSVQNDPGLASLINTGCGVICIVGKTWDFHVTDALGISLEDNLAMVKDSVSYLASKGVEVLFDAEHFFDGYKANKDYALLVATAAYEAGARWIVLCDTNGGTLPSEIEAIIHDVVVHVPGDHLGIHCHNDTEHAVANSLAAVRAGARQIQGTLNGVGERCGNANLVSIIPTLMLKMGYDTGISEDALSHITKTSRALDARLNRLSNPYAAYVGESAFAHKGGLHVSAVAKNPKAYEHIVPEQVGNQRKILISNQAGRSNIVARLRDIDIDPAGLDNAVISRLVEEIKERESVGYAYDSADASFELLVRRVIETTPKFFTMEYFNIVDERLWDDKGDLQTTSIASIRVRVGDVVEEAEASGNGPVNALDSAMRKALVAHFPCLQSMVLTDYKVRIVNSSAGTDAITRVLIETEDQGKAPWTTVGVSTNIIDASYNALRDSIYFALLKQQVE